MWKVERIVRKGDYNYAVVKDHPRANRFGYVLHHRVVVENHLRRLLDPSEVVHHRNHNRLDNRIENLEVMKISEHERMHGLEKGRLWVDLCCPWCCILFSKPKSCIQKPSSYFCCSKSCRGKTSRHIQLHGLTTELESAISGNIVREYRKYSTDNPEETCDNQGSVETIRTPPETVKR